MYGTINFGYHSTPEIVVPSDHKICNFFILSLIFFEPMMLLFFYCLSRFAEQVSDILQFPSVYNFPHHLHTCFLIYPDDRILPNQSVLKWSLILAAYNSDFFCSVYGYVFLSGPSLWKLCVPERQHYRACL